MIDLLRDEPWLVFLITIVVLVTGVAVFLAVKEERECEARGGEMVGTGEFYTTTTMVNNVPMVQVHERQECTVPA